MGGSSPAACGPLGAARQLEALRGAGCTPAQGYLLGGPGPLAEALTGPLLAPSG